MYALKGDCERVGEALILDECVSHMTLILPCRSREVARRIGP